MSDRSNIFAAVGGSAGTEFETISSDFDVFSISDHEHTPAVVQAATKFLTRKVVDFEHMSVKRFDALIASLRVYNPVLSAGISPYALSELRFLIRAAKGRTFMSDEHIQGQLASIGNQLRLAAQFYISSMFVMKYQDVYGFVDAGRYNDVTLLSGELAQFASLLSLLEIELTDLSLKAAPRRTLTCGHRLVEAAAAQLLDHICARRDASDAEWANSLLLRVNALVAAGILTARGVQKFDSASYEISSRAEYCVLGSSEYLATVNVRTNGWALTNEAYLWSLLRQIGPCCRSN